MIRLLFAVWKNLISQNMIHLVIRNNKSSSSVVFSELELIISGHTPCRPHHHSLGSAFGRLDGKAFVRMEQF